MKKANTHTFHHSFGTALLSAISTAFLFGNLLTAAELELDVTFAVRGGGANTDGTAKPQINNKIILVVDKSGSMTSPITRKDGKKPKDLLLESLKIRTGSLNIGDEVYLLPFSSEVEENAPDFQRPVSIQGDAQREYLLQVVQEMKFGGATLLYDAQATALRKAQELISKDANARVLIYVYTDGGHDTRKPDGKKHYEGTKYKCDGTEKERKIAFKKFTDEFAAYFTNPKFEIEYQWLSDHPNPDLSIWTKKTALKIDMFPETLSLRNPVSVPNQKVELVMEFQMPASLWGQVEGEPMELIFEVDGKRMPAKVVKLEKGKKTVTIDLPNLPIDREIKANLLLERLPQGKDFEFSTPKPVEFVFVKPGVVAPSSIKPADGFIVCVGDTVHFSAEATEGATLDWELPDGTRKRDKSAEWTFSTAGEANVKVTASKTGFISSTVTRVVEVIETGVLLAPILGQPTVGKPMKFSASAKGPAKGIEWIVSGQTYAGTSTFEYFFTESGPHTVQARAFYEKVLPVLSQELAINVAPAPYLVIRNPADGAEFDAGQEVSLEAGVEGGFERVVWKITGPTPLERVSQVEPALKASAPTVVSFAKGGAYTITAIAEGGGVGAKTSEPISITVLSPDFSVKVEKPFSDSRLENGKEYEYMASVTGKGIEYIKWLAKDMETDKITELGISPVINGKSRKAHTFPTETGNASIEILAEPVFTKDDPNASEKIKLSTVVVTTYTEGDLVIVRGESVNGWERPFGTPLPLKAKTTGAVKNVEWFADYGKGSEKIGDGTERESPKKSADGREKLMAEFWAEGKMPDGSVKRTEKMRVVFYCPPLELKIKLPEKDGVVRSEFALGENIAFELKHNGRLDDIRWDFGDEKVLSNAVVSVTHTYTNYAEYVVMVDAICKECCVREQKDEKVVVVQGLVVPKFEIKNEKGKYGVGDTLMLVDKSAGGDDIATWIWKIDTKNGNAEFSAKSIRSPSVVRHWQTNGVEFLEKRNASEVVVRCVKVGGFTVSLSVAPKSGGDLLEAESISKEIWRKWLLFVVIIVGVPLLIWVCYFYSGNGPKNWIVRGKVGPEKIHGSGRDGALTDDDLADWPKRVTLSDYDDKGKRHYWSRNRKEAIVPLKKLVDADDDGEQWPLNKGEFIIKNNKQGKHTIDLRNTATGSDDEPSCLPSKHRFRDTAAQPFQYLHIWVDERSGSSANVWAIVAWCFIILFVGVMVTLMFSM